MLKPHLRTPEKRIFRMWFEFFLITLFGAGIFRIVVDGLVNSYSQEGSGDGSTLQTIAAIVIWSGTVSISYFAFRYVTGKAFRTSTVNSNEGI